MKSWSHFPLWSKFRTSVLLYFRQCPRKAPLLRSRFHTQSTICSFQYFDQFSDLDLRQNIFNLIIFISNKKLPWAVSFEFISGILFSLYSERKQFVSKPSRSYWTVANKRIFNYLCLIYQEREKRIKSFYVTVGIQGFSAKPRICMGCNLDR